MFGVSSIQKLNMELSKPEEQEKNRIECEMKKMEMEKETDRPMVMFVGYLFD